MLLFEICGAILIREGLFADFRVSAASPPPDRGHVQARARNINEANGGHVVLIYLHQK